MRFYLGVVLCAAVLASGCASVAATSGRVVIQDENKSLLRASITTRDRVLIGDYYAGQKKKKSTPATKIKPGATPPPAQSEPLPPELERQLSPLSPNQLRARIGRDVVLLDKRTRAVLDAAHGVAD